MFDPQKVDRWDASDEHVNSTGEFVLASDYDQLLRIYRETVRTLEWMRGGHMELETAKMVAKAEINTAYECGDLA